MQPDRWVEIQDITQSGRGNQDVSFRRQDVILANLELVNAL